jgi:hypothetical protein
VSVSLFKLTNFATKRAGLTKERCAWVGICSVWHEFEDDNQAQLTSLGTTFNLLESLDDTWGELRAGVNLFTRGGATSDFLKVDVAFGDDLEGVGGQVGGRYKW